MNGQPSARKYVYLFREFDEVVAKFDDDWETLCGLLGGKGANLLDATRLGIPVPPGFTVTTEACNVYLASDETFPKGLWEQVLDSISSLEEQTGKKFGDIENPLLVSCRSGARFSMPGMMDTILNIGLNDEIAAKLATRTHRPRFAYDLYRRLVQMFGGVVMGVPDEVFEAVITAQRRESGAQNDAELDARAWKAVTIKFREIIRTYTGKEFPTDPYEQLKQATRGKDPPILGKGEYPHGPRQKAADPEYARLTKGPLGVYQQKSPKTEDKEHHPASVKKGSQKDHDPKGNPGVTAPEFLRQNLGGRTLGKGEGNTQDQTTGNHPREE